MHWHVYGFKTLQQNLELEYKMIALKKYYSFYPSEAHATAGLRPAVARSERSERSVRKALLQKIDLKNMSPHKDLTEKKCVPQ